MCACTLAALARDRLPPGQWRTSFASRGSVRADRTSAYRVMSHLRRGSGELSPPPLSSFSPTIFDEIDHNAPSGILSPLLANIALSALDEHFARQWEPDRGRRERRKKNGPGNWRLVHYADDFVVMVSGPRERTGTLRADAAAVLAPLGLQLAEEKTRVVSKKVFSKVDAHAWNRIMRWLRNKYHGHGGLGMPQLKRRFCLRGTWIFATNGIRFSGASATPVTRYRYRANRIPTP